MPVRGLRGATVAGANSADEIYAATRELLEALVAANSMDPADIASVFFTTTPDLTAAYPALAARQLGWTDIALLCGHEMAVPGGLPLCIRVLVHWNTDRPAADLRHMYLRAAVQLRPDRASSV